MRITQKTNVINHSTVTLLCLALVFPLPFLLVEDKLLAFFVNILLYIVMALITIFSYLSLERIQINDTELKLRNAFRCKQSVDLNDISYMISRVVYIPRGYGMRKPLIGCRVIEFHTYKREVVRIYVDMYEKGYVEMLVLSVMRVNRSIRWYA